MTEANPDLSKLAEPFESSDIEWRVSRAGMGQKGVFCMVLAYITARGTQKRLDDVCGPENWRLEEPRILEINGKSAFACGLSIRIGDEWVTKWDVAEPTNIEPAKGGWSGAVKRAASAWSVGRYLYYLDETFAEVVEKPLQGARGWNYAKLPEKHGGGAYYWKTPSLPAWALPADPEHEITLDELNDLKRAWKDKFAPDSQNPKDLREGFARFVHSICGEFPINDVTCWLREFWEKCIQRIAETTDPGGVDSDIPFSD